MKLRLALVIISTLLINLLPASASFAQGGTVTFQGTIGSLPASGLIGDWRVGDRTVHITSATQINQDRGHAVVGATVGVAGTVRSDNSVDASRIEVLTVPSTPVHFQGTIESLPASGLVGDWRISGHTVRVTSPTQVVQEHGQAVVGASVDVYGTSLQE